MFMPQPTVLYEDDSLIAFDKPSGMPLAPDRQHKSAEDLMTVVRRSMGDHIANVYRLDPDTSGVVLCTKTKTALDFVSGQFQSKTAGKKFFAIVVGAPTEDVFTVDLPLADDSAQLGRMRVHKK